MLFTKETLFTNQAPSFNFELNADQLLEKALEVGFVTELGAKGSGVYQMNDEYGQFERARCGNSYGDVTISN